MPQVYIKSGFLISELMTLCCGVLFFLAFFIAMYVEVKAKNTVYQVTFIQTNKSIIIISLLTIKFIILYVFKILAT